MNKKLFQSSKSLLSKLCLTSLLLIGMGNTAWADTVVVDGSTIAAGWLTGQIASTTNKVSIPDETAAISTTGSFTNATTYLGGYKYGWYALYSTQKVSIESSQKIIIGAQGMGSTSAKLCVKYSSTSQTDNSTFTAIATFTTEIRSSSLQEGFTDLVVENIPEGEYYFQIISKAVNINSVVITDPTTISETPKLNVSTTAVDFGTLRASDTQTVTVTNTGVGTMDVTIVNDNSTDFTVSATELTGIGAGELQTFDVTFNYDAANLGEKTASITVTPSYDAADAKTIAVTATAADAAVWEDFSDGIPSTWYNQNNSWLTNVSGLNGMASPGWMASDILRTPRLYAEAGEVIGYDVKIGGTTSSYKLKAQYSTDREEWIDIATYTTTDTYYFTAPSTGYYWLRFTAYSSGIDNFRGWSVADITHEIKLGTATIPTEGTIFGKYTANVDVMELGGSEENITAELYFGETKVTEETVTIGGNRDETITLTYDLTEAFSGDVYIKVSGDNITAMETDKVNVTIGDTEYILDENEEAVPAFDCSDAVVRINYTAKKGWNSIIMPFSLTGKSDYMNSIFGEGWKAYEMTAYNNGELTFENKTSMRYSVPYIVYAPNAETHPDGVYLTNIDIDSEEWTSSSIAQTKDGATFQGTYVPKTYADSEDAWYGLTPDGKIRKAGSGASVKAFHAYFTGISAPASGARLIVIEDDGEATNLGFVQMVDPEAKGVYTLSGQKVESAGKGIYIVNGKKVVIK